MPNVRRYYNRIQFNSLSLLSVDNLAHVQERLHADDGEEVPHRVVEVCLDYETVVLDLDNVVNDCGHLFVLHCGNELLTSLNNTHDLPTEVTVSGHSSVVHAIVVLALCGDVWFTGQVGLVRPLWPVVDDLLVKHTMVGLLL